MLARMRCPFTYRDREGVIQLCGQLPVLGSYCFDHAEEVPGSILAVLEKREGQPVRAARRNHLKRGVVTVTLEQIRKAKVYGLSNVEAIAAAANSTGCKFYLACAMIWKESKGRNIYGHDAGGALAGFPAGVNAGNYAVFRWLVFDKKQASNGVGPAQLTYRGFFTDMEAKGLRPYNAAENIGYGVGLLWGYYRIARNAGKSVTDAIREAGTKYNGAEAYGDDLVKVANELRLLLGNADYT